MGEIRPRVSFMLGTRREIGTLLGKDSAMRLAHVRLDSGRELVLDWLEVEQQGIMDETGETWDELKDFERRVLERDRLMQAFEDDRDHSAGVDRPLEDEHGNQS